MAPFTPLVLCIVLVGALAEPSDRTWRNPPRWNPRIMSVTVPRPEVTTQTGRDIRLPCTYSIPPAQSGLKPNIAWYKGDDGIATATRILSLSYQGASQVAVGHGAYVGRVSLENPADATLTLRGVQLADKGRYWCAVFDSDAHNELGMDSKSVLLTVTDPYVQFDDSQAGRPGFLALDVPTQRGVWQGDDVVLPCLCNGCSHHATKTWFTVSFNENWMPTEKVIATDTPCLSHQCPGGTTTVTADFRDHFSLTNEGLKISGVRKSDTHRYWCQVDDFTYSRGSGVDAKSVVVGVASRCTGKVEGLYQHPDDCAKFYLCGPEGLQYDGLYTCPDGLLFHQALQRCEWANTVTCL